VAPPTGRVGGAIKPPPGDIRLLTLGRRGKDGDLLILEGRISGKKARIMIDSGGQTNFIDEEMVNHFKIPHLLKEIPDTIQLASSLSLSISLRVVRGGHSDACACFLE
jgi:hypothetical protein